MDFNFGMLWEGVMLFCFGFSWPFAILKTIRAKNPAGKSYLFLSLIIIGYVAGCLHKICVKSVDGEEAIDWLFWAYVGNGLMVAMDMSLCLFYQHRLNKLNREKKD